MGATDRVSIDGREVRREEDVAANEVDPGSHVVRVVRGGEATEQMLYVGRNDVRVINVDRSGPVAPSDATQYRHAPALVSSSAGVARRDDRVLPWVLLSGGLVFVAGGGVLLLSATADASTRDEMRARWCTATACTGTTATHRAILTLAGRVPQRALGSLDDTGGPCLSGVERLAFGVRGHTMAVMSDRPVPTLFEWIGGAPALERLFTVFYGRVLQDPILAPVFASM